MQVVYYAENGLFRRTLLLKMVAANGFAATFEFQTIFKNFDLFFIIFGLDINERCLALKLHQVFGRFSQNWARGCSTRA